MKKVLALILAVVALTMMLTACGGTKDPIGTWELSQDGVTMELTFEEEGKGSVSTMGISADMTWSTDDGKLTVSMSLLGETQELFTDAEYSVKGDELSITVDDETTVLTKKEAE